MNRQAPSVRAPATYQDVLDAPPNMVAELVGGVLHLQPRPASRHARASFRLAGRLDDPFEGGVGGPGGWYLTIEPELHFGKDVLVPDLAGWRRERMGEFPDVPDAVVQLHQTDLIGVRHNEGGEIKLPDLVMKTNLIASKSEARRLIIQGGIEVDGEKASDPNECIRFRPNQQRRLKIGRTSSL